MKTPAEKAAAVNAWRQKNPDRWAEIQRRSTEKNRERIRARDRARTPRPKTPYAALSEAEKGKRRAASKDYVSRHPQAQTAHSRCVHARQEGRVADYQYLRTMPCPAVCPILGTPIAFAYGKGQRPAENTASFDRIDPAGGYVAGNVQILSLRANQMKSDSTPEQLLAFARWVLARHDILVAGTTT
jgi:hypothetical protein